MFKYAFRRERNLVLFLFLSLKIFFKIFLSLLNLFLQSSFEDSKINLQLSCKSNTNTLKSVYVENYYVIGLIKSSKIDYFSNGS